KIRLGSLCELKCDTSIGSSYFYGLARICQDIQRLVIVNEIPKANHGIAKLIEVQKNLKHFEWKDDFKDIDYLIEDPYKEILLELEKKADKINHLKIYFQFVGNYEHILLQKILPKFYKLKTLIIDDFVWLLESEMMVYHD